MSERGGSTWKVTTGTVICLDKYPFPTVLFFVGLILGGIPLLWNKAKAAKGKWSNWGVFGITFAIVLTFAFLKSGNYEDIYDMISFVSVLYDPDKQDKEFLHKLKDINYDWKNGIESDEIYIKFADKNDKKMVKDYIKKNKAKSDSKINE